MTPIFVSRIYFVLLLFVLSLDVLAQDKGGGPLENTTIGFHLGSVHSATGYNDFNPGVYIKFQNNITFGNYYNSNYHQSTYAGYTYAYNNNIDITTGLITGYQIYRYTPLLIPSYKFPNLIDAVTLRVAFIPRFFGVVQANVIHAMVETNF